MGIVDEILEGATANFKQNFIRRLKEVGLVIYGWGAPVEVGEYLDNAHLCYLHGMFISSIVMASLAIETTLRVEYTKVTGKKRIAKKERGRKGEFQYLIEWAAQNRIIPFDQAREADKIRRKTRNKLFHIKAFTDDELRKIYELRVKRIEDLTNAECEMLASYSLRTEPSETFTRRIIETSDKIIEHTFPEIGRIPFDLNDEQE